MEKIFRKRILKSMNRTLAELWFMVHEDIQRHFKLQAGPISKFEVTIRKFNSKKDTLLGVQGPPNYNLSTEQRIQVQTIAAALAEACRQKNEFVEKFERNQRKGNLYHKFLEAYLKEWDELNLCKRAADCLRQIEGILTTHSK